MAYDGKKTFFLLQIDHKHLKITRLVEIRNLNVVVLFIQKNRSYSVYMYLFTGRSCSVYYGGSIDVQSKGQCSVYVYISVEKTPTMPVEILVK